ncbi:uncharacterized protein LOC135385444 isoform X2 [Ornithodoros turicata]|uniref:uncharacterized protein LOC135385444 isoform X2 n=1 Tax=Ornithodoros turicata TaxID=34597 RepID=UPI003139052C
MDTSHINDRMIAELLQGDEEYEFINMAQCGTAGISPEVDVEIALAVERALESDGSGIILYDTREHSPHLDIPTRPTSAPAQNSPCDVTNDEVLARVLQALENEGSSEEEDCTVLRERAPSPADNQQSLLGDLFLIDEEANFQRPGTPPPPSWLMGQTSSPFEEKPDDELEQCAICRERFSECDSLQRDST